jgi:molecular chaperone HtpG
MDSTTRIGKDVIDSLTTSMYEDHLCIYREYIQNSADQIDLALEQGLLSANNPGQIEIKIDHKNGRIEIEDNATGIESSKVEGVLKNIAKSSKERGKNKGFRGIGRLGGIAYCDKLIFETSCQGEPVKSRLVWNAKKLKAILNDRTTTQDAIDVIDNVTTFENHQESEQDHYFKVILEGVTNSDLLDKHKTRDYLRMVAPAPYNKGFIFKDTIRQKIQNLGYSIDEYNIYVNTDKIDKNYTTSIYSGSDNDKSRIDELKDIQFFEVPGQNSQTLALGWYGISNFERQIPSVNQARGIRLRKGNIQIGDNNTMSKFFKEQRGNHYFFGEVFVFSENIIPNARRDYFIENEQLKEFENSLRQIISEPLYKIYHFASDVRSAKRKLEDLETFEQELVKKSKSGFTNDDEKKKYEANLQKKKESAEKAKQSLKKLEEKVEGVNDPRTNIYKNITGDLVDKKTETIVDDILTAKTTYATDGLSKLNRKERKLVSDIFNVIDSVLTPDLAENLKEKVKQSFK